MQAFTYLFLPAYWSSRNRVRRSERADFARAWVFGGVAVLVFAALFWGAFWITTQLDAYDELGDFLLRIGLSWLFLTFLSFLAFSGIVTALSTFFLSEDLRLLLATPVAVRRLFFRALREDGAAVVVDGRRLSAAGAARRRRRALRAVHVLRDGAADGGAVLRHSCRRRHRARRCCS